MKNQIFNDVELCTLRACIKERVKSLEKFMNSQSNAERKSWYRDEILHHNRILIKLKEIT